MAVVSVDDHLIEPADLFELLFAPACNDEDGDGATTDEEVQDVEDGANEVQDRVDQEIEGQDEGTNDNSDDTTDSTEDNG